MKDIEDWVIGRKKGVGLRANSLISGYEVDSRQIKPGSLFFALKGERCDGHDFLGEVASKGALGAVVKHSYQGPDFGLKLYKVDDVLSTLQFLGKDLLEERKTAVIGITGSVGKTTTKDFTWTVLAEKFSAGKSPLNKNTKISLPLSLLNQAGKEGALVLEMGMSEKGDLANLIQIAPPEIALVTSVGLAHAEFFPDGIRGIAKGKMEIFSHPKTRLGIIAEELLIYEDILRQSSCPKKTYSLQNPKADFYLAIEKEGCCVYESGVKSPFFHLPFTERHFVQNALAAISIARFMQMTYDEIIPKLQELKSPKMRFEKIEKNGVLFINDAYNASPLSVKAALLNLPKPQKGGKTIAVLGEMRELGYFAEECHREIGKTAAVIADHLLCFGEKCAFMCEEFQKTGKNAELFPTHESLTEKLRSIINKNDVVLIKGSRSMQMEKILDQLDRI